MTSGAIRRVDFSFNTMGLSAFSGPPDVHQRHRHNEVELSVFEKAPITALYGGRQWVVPPNRLVVFWGAMPHQALKTGKATMGYGLRVPLAWVLRWNLPQSLTRRLVDLDVFVEPIRTQPCSDLDLVKHWVSLLRKNSLDRQRIVLLEVEARLRLLAMESRAHDRSPPPTAPGPLDRFEQVIEMIASRYTERLGIPEIARAVGLHRNYVMRLFRKITGMTVLEYITHHRVCHAQRLLAMTNMKIVDVAYESGFSSATRFHEAFHKAVGQPPGRYRRSLQLPDGDRIGHHVRRHKSAAGSSRHRS